MNDALLHIKNGGILAYPTETVFGIGGRADLPEVIEKIQLLKGRSAEKRFLMVAKDWAQISDWLNVPNPPDFPERPTTYLYPVSASAPHHLVLNGKMAVRISHHQTVKALCRDYPLISTSANLSGYPPARTVAGVQSYFPDLWIIEGQCDPEALPSQIIDYLTGEIIRQ